jgi:hypothetical protein
MPHGTVACGDARLVWTGWQVRVRKVWVKSLAFHHRTKVADWGDTLVEGPMVWAGHGMNTRPTPG